MKRKLLLLSILLGWQFSAQAADLLEVYQDALGHDTIYQQAISQRFITNEGVPISVAALLPNINLTFDPNIKRSAFAGSNVSGGASAFSPRNNTEKAYDLSLNLTQTVFNFTQYAAVKGALANAKGADATLNAALQSLMTRVASAYFAILNDEDNVAYNQAYKRAYAEQLDQVKQQYNVGLKTITDVYTAQASYESASSSLIAAETQLANDKENLRVITGKYYTKLSSLSEEFPLISPQPQNVDDWVSTAQQQNWSIKAAQYAVANALYSYKQQFGGHLPTVSLQGTLDRIYTNDINGYRNISSRNGPSTETDRAIAINVTMPLVAGGGVVASTNQAAYQYQLTQQQMEQTVLNTINTTRQSYLNILTGISKITADKQAIKSNISSVEGMEASYRVGTETLVNVLNQRQKLFQAETQYATDRYAFVNNVLALKQAAGTLGFDDLRSINAWLVENKSTNVGYPPIRGRNNNHNHMHMDPSTQNQTKNTPSVSQSKQTQHAAKKSTNTHKMSAAVKKSTFKKLAHNDHRKHKQI